MPCGSYILLWGEVIFLQRMSAWIERSRSTWGAITTLLAGLPLFFCVLIFFNKFATLIVSTILYSLYFSLVFFSAVCFAIGPQGTFADLRPPLKRLYARCCKKGKQEEDKNQRVPETKESGHQLKQIEVGLPPKEEEIEENSNKKEQNL